MAVPRPVLFAVLGLAMLVALFLSTRNGAQNESVTPPPSAAKPAPAPKAPADKPGSKAATRQTTAPQPKAVTPKKPKLADDVPPKVREAARALGEDQVVVFLFSKPGAADDTGARVAVDEIEGMKGVKVIRAGLEDVGAFRPMLAQLEISQVPATAIVRPGRKAVLLQGFVDAGTLRQNVADARR
jgi:hypothetical protein